jgi:hypothetical protein
VSRPIVPCRSGKEEDCGEARRYPHAQNDDAIEPQIELGHGGTTEQQVEARTERVRDCGNRAAVPWIAAAGGLRLFERAKVLLLEATDWRCWSRRLRVCSLSTRGAHARPRRQFIGFVFESVEEGA